MPRGPGREGGHSQRSRMGRGNLREVRDGSRDPPIGPGRVGGLPRRSGTGREVLRNVQNGSRGPPWGPGLVGRPVQGFATGGGYLGRSEMGGEILRKFWHRLVTLQKVRNGSGDPPEGPGWVRDLRGSGTGRRFLPEVQDGSGEPPGGSGWVGGLSRRSSTGLEVLRKVRDG